MGVYLLKEVAEKLRFLRESVKLSQVKMAEIVGVKQSSLNRYELNQASPTFETLTRYADYFDVSMDYIFGRTDHPQGKLYEYKHRFGITVATSLGWIALGVYGAVAFLGEVFLWELPLPGMDATVPNLVLFLLQLVHTAGLLSATDCLARQVGAEKVKSAIPWDAGILGTWAVGQVILLLFPAVAAFEDQTVTKIVLLIQLIGYLMVCLTLLRAYRLICPAGEEENAPRKRSRFALINRINDKLEERSKRALEESMEYRRQREESRCTRRNGKRKK